MYRQHHVSEDSILLGKQAVIVSQNSIHGLVFVEVQYVFFCGAGTGLLLLLFKFQTSAV
jgi:hypothetical protein